MFMNTVKVASVSLIVDTESYSRLFLNHPILWTVFGIFFLGFCVFMFLNYKHDKKQEKEMGKRTQFEQQKEQLKNQMRSTGKSLSSGSASKNGDNRHTIAKDQIPEQVATGSIGTTMLNQIESNQDKQNDSSSHKHHHDSSSPSSHHSTSHHDSSSSSGSYGDSGSSSSSSDSGSSSD